MCSINEKDWRMWRRAPSVLMERISKEIILLEIITFLEKLRGEHISICFTH